MIDNADQIARRLGCFLSQAKLQSARTLDKALEPIAKFAIARLRCAVPVAKKNLAPSIWQNLNQHLKDRFAFVLEPTLRVEQRAEQAVARSLGDRRFTGEIALRKTFKLFPGLPDTVARLTADWIDAQRELLARLSRDRAIIREKFLGGQRQFRVVAIQPSLSDPHNGGRTVTLIEFAGNRRVIYKPRPCDGERLWFRALDWLSRNGIGRAFCVLRLVSRKNYCWMEFLPSRGCRNLGEVRRFYFRWGVQTALAQILGASDLHRENWRACGEQPILVDAESIGNDPMRGLQDRQSLRALLETGLLPLIERDRAGIYKGIAPFDLRLAKSAAPNCWPRCKGIIQTPARYVNDLIRGFEATVKIFSHPAAPQKFFREVIQRPLRDRRGRIFARASGEYARLLAASLAPSNMMARGQRWRWLARRCCESSLNQRIGLAEARALVRCDIPKFTAAGRTSGMSWEQLNIAIAELTRSSRLLRRRVLLGARTRRATR